MKNIIPVIIAIGVVIALIVFGYTLGYRIGSTIGKDLTNIVEQNEADIIDIPITDTVQKV